MGGMTHVAVVRVSEVNTGSLGSSLAWRVNAVNVREAHGGGEFVPPRGSEAGCCRARPFPIGRSPSGPAR
jgi:hypothetical protein